MMAFFQKFLDGCHHKWLFYFITVFFEDASSFQEGPNIELIQHRQLLVRDESARDCEPCGSFRIPVCQNAGFVWQLSRARARALCSRARTVMCCRCARARYARAHPVT